MWRRKLMTQPITFERRPLNLAFILRAVLILSIAVIILIPLLAGASFMGVLTAGGCYTTDTPATLPGAFQYATDVNVPSAQWGSIPAFWVVPPAHNGGVVITIPTGSANRGDRAAEWQHYVNAGFAVLSYASPACVGQGYSSLGYTESFVVNDMLTWLAMQPGVDAAHIGLHGFSAGGASALFAGGNPQVAAVVAEGNYMDFAQQIDENSTAWGLLGVPFRWGAYGLYQVRTGYALEILNPGAVVSQLAPRPILMIYGTAEPAHEAARAVAAANPNVTFWSVQGATHGAYLAAGEAEYAARIVDFMQATIGSN